MTVFCMTATLKMDSGIPEHSTPCANNGIVLNVDKFKFAAEIVEFAGFKVTMDGFGPTQNTIDSIINYPTSNFVVRTGRFRRLRILGERNHATFSSFMQGIRKSSTGMTLWRSYSIERRLK